MTGDDSRLPFSLLFSLRSHLLHEPFLSAITVLVIGLSVALAVAMQMSSAAIRTELTRTAEALIGAAQIEVTSGKVGIPERLLGEVAQVEGVRSAAPIIETTVRLMGEKAEGLALHILGVDFLADREVRQYTALRGELAATDPLRLAVTPDAVIVSYRLADQLGLSERDTFEVWTSQGRKRLTVRGIFQPGGVSDAYGRQLLVMDVYSLQTLLGREGWLDRVDIVLDREAELEAVREAVVARVAGRAEVRRPRNRDQFVEAVMSTLVLITNAFAVVAVIAAGLVAFGSAYVSVERRTRTFALLRAAGLRGSQLRRLVYLDALVAGVLGTGLGLFIGWTLSGTVFGLFSRLGQYYQSEVAPSLDLTAFTLALGLAVGLGISLLGAVIPARRAAIQHPMVTLTATRSLEDPSRSVSRRSLSLALAMLLLWGLAITASDFLPASWQSGLIFCLGLGALILLSGVLLRLISRSAGSAFERVAGGVGRFVSGSLRLSLAQTRTAIAAISGVLAAVSMVWIVMSSVANTIQSARIIRGETMITAGDIFESTQRTHVSDRVAEQISRTEGVIAIVRHYWTEIPFRGETIGLSTADYGIFAGYGEFPVLAGGDTRTVSQKIAQGGVAIDQMFAKHFGLGVGDVVQVATPVGHVRFPIVGIVERYVFAETGSIRMDMRVFDSLWKRPGSTNLLMWTNESPQNTIERIRARIGSSLPLFFTTPQELENRSRRFIFRTSMVLYVLMALTLLLGGIAMLGLLMNSVVSQRRDFALLTAAGYSAGQILETVALRGAFVATFGAIAGICLGVSCALAFVGVFEDLYGWVIHLELEPSDLGLLVLGSSVVGALVGLIPARLALRGSAAALAPE